MRIGISVIVCCYNSADRLPETLRHLAQQKVPQFINWEVIIINNASTDNTYKIAIESWKQYNAQAIGFKVFDIQTPGKNYAFKKGVDEAAFEYLLTCDDDNRLGEHYVANAFHIMQADTSIGVLGGRGIFDAEMPSWPEADQFKNSYVNGSQTWAKTDYWVYGAGSVCRKSILIEFYENNWQPITTGRTGSKLICGEDVELCFMYYLNGYKIVANDSLTFRHFVPLKRQNISYILKLYFWQSYSYVLLSPYLSLIDKDTRGLNNRLDDILLSTKKALIKELTKLAYQKLIRWKSIDRMQQFTLQSYYGTLLSVYQNKKKMIAHFNQLKKVLNKPLPPLQNGIVTAK